MTSPAIFLSHISKRIGKKTILQDVSLSVETGSIFGLLGPNGSGKTTLMKIILGFIEPETGDRMIQGAPFSRETLRHIGFMPESTYFYKYLTGKEFLEFHGKLYGMHGNILQERIGELLERVDLTEEGTHKRLGTYSKGMLERIGLAQALLHDPDILLLDEPMSGLDPIGRRLIKNILIEFAQAGKTIFFNTHFLSDVEELCTHFAILSNGTIVTNMKRDDLHESLEDLFIRTVRPPTKKEPETTPHSAISDRLYNE